MSNSQMNQELQEDTLPERKGFAARHPLMCVNAMAALHRGRKECLSGRPPSCVDLWLPRRTIMPYQIESAAAEMVGASIARDKLASWRSEVPAREINPLCTVAGEYTQEWS